MATNYKLLKQKRILKSLRALNDMSQQDAADLIGVSRNTYCKKENGKCTFLLSEAKILAEHFGQPLEEIFLL